MNIDKDALQRLVSKVGSKQAERVLAALGKQSKLMVALSSDVGQEIMKESTHKINTLLCKIIDETSTINERAEYRVLRSILDSWSSKIARYQSTLDSLFK